MSAKASLCQAETCLLTWERCGGKVAQKSPNWDSDVDVWTRSEGIDENNEEISKDNTRRVFEKFGTNPAGEECGPFWILGMSCECARRPADGTNQKNQKRTMKNSKKQNIFFEEKWIKRKIQSQKIKKKKKSETMKNSKSNKHFFRKKHQKTEL